MGHDHGPPYVVPHYSTFKVDGIKQLQELEKALERKGLKDPWIRNEAWRYHPGFGTRGSRALKVFFRGLPLGAALTVLTVAVGAAMGTGGGDDHGHKHH